MENNSLSEFMKLPYKQGKVKDSSEAFDEYPVENEFHKGSFVLLKISPNPDIINM